MILHRLLLPLRHPFRREFQCFVQAGLAGGLLLLLPGCGSHVSQTREASSARLTDAKELIILVQDEAGNPIPGAEVEREGVRPSGSKESAVYFWRPVITVTTNSQGIAHLGHPSEVPGSVGKGRVGSLDLSISHPEYSTTSVTAYSIEGSARPIVLKRGLSLEVSGYFGRDREPVRDLIPTINRDIPVTQVGRPKEWQEKSPNSLIFKKLSAGDHVLQLSGRLKSGEVVYSDGFAFTAEKGHDYHFALEMKRGIRLEGRLDDRALRPIKNGWVEIRARPSQFPGRLAAGGFNEVVRVYERYGSFDLWQSYRPIAEDGTFVFETVPAGEVEAIVFGEGFVSKNPDDPTDGSPHRGIPQTFRSLHL